MHAPGLLWILILGACGFLAGFVGPIVVNPTSNSAPLIGIFVSGPIGLAIGIVAYIAMRFIAIAPSTQWVSLIAIAAIGTVATVLNAFPGETVKGYIVQSEVVRCGAPHTISDALLAEWQKEVDQVTWQTPTAGWRDHMQQLLQNDTGVVIDARVTRRIGIHENHKPWNKGTLYVEDKIIPNDSALYYDARANKSCAAYANGTKFETWMSYENTPKPPAEWPPSRLEQFMRRMPIDAVPAQYRAMIAPGTTASTTSTN